MDYEAEGNAVRARTAHLKAQRLEKEAKEKVAVAAKKKKTVLFRLEMPNVSGDNHPKMSPRKPLRWRAKKSTALATGRQPMSSGQAASDGYSRGRKNFAIYAMISTSESASADAILHRANSVSGPLSDVSAKLAPRRR
jgi:hypothetical protein